ncbi:thermonuclease family protein [Ruegeria denitrificans]|uniref:thermonuclease family protein n=1 Tax=Ruegeria denitrificans TaxID=1715692 RepID=UPI001FB44A5D|nr:thermonuclease family protein [Ruegeria denitrificans]
MKPFLIAFALLMGRATNAMAGEQPDVVGAAQIRDVDTVVVSGVPIRLNGVDGPELGTAAGRDARRWMVNHLRNRTVACFLTGAKTYDRHVGSCFIQENGTKRWIDIGASAISAGHALDCRRYSGGKYADLETPAAKSRIKRADYCR